MNMAFFVLQDGSKRERRRSLWRTARERAVWLRDVRIATERSHAAWLAWAAAVLADRCGRSARRHSFQLPSICHIDMSTCTQQGLHGPHWHTPLEALCQVMC